MFRLEPHGIENLITFAGESKNVRGRYAVRQLVSREMERERIRRRRGGIHIPVPVPVPLVAFLLFF